MRGGGFDTRMSPTTEDRPMATKAQIREQNLPYRRGIVRLSSEHEALAAARYLWAHTGVPFTPVASTRFKGRWVLYPHGSRPCLQLPHDLRLLVESPGFVPLASVVNPVEARRSLRHEVQRFVANTRR